MQSNRSILKEKKELGTRGYPKMFLIGGPCSAESKKQLFETALRLKQQHIDVFRAGIWKPRTRPNSFEGIGKIALTWLQQIKKETNLKTIVEVASPKHVELALKYDVDMLWIGARTTVSPFAVQEIANTVRNLPISIFVKNPINPDLELWTGGIERIQDACIKEVAAIHRGFSTGVKSIYRNEPKWEIPLELKKRFPKMKLLCDPSHIAGTRDLLKEICTHAIELKYDGFMIEAHINPENALSDAKQQVLPETIPFLINSKAKKLNNMTQKKLGKLREQIDKTDTDILNILLKRMKIADQLGYIKEENSLSILQYERFIEVIQSRKNYGEEIGLNKRFLKELYHLIHNEAVRRQYIHLGE